MATWNRMSTSTTLLFRPQISTTLEAMSTDKSEGNAKPLYMQIAKLEVEILTAKHTFM